MSRGSPSTRPPAQPTAPATSAASPATIPAAPRTGARLPRRTEIAQAKANLNLGTPAELTASQTTLATQFGEKLQGRVREFVSLATEVRASFTELVGETAAKVAETIKKSA
jgi:hypothetical protein